MRSGVALAGEQTTADKLAMDKRSAESGEMRNPRPEPATSYELEILISRQGESQTRGRAANLPIPDCHAATVREVLQLVVEAARQLIGECLAKDNHIPWISPPAQAEETESRFVVPLQIS